MRRLIAIAAILLAGCSARRASTHEEGYVIAADGVRLYYEKSGKGGPVIIAPGGRALEPWLQSLAAEGTYVRYDPRNRGRSARIADLSKVGVEQDIADLEAVRAHIRADRIVTVAWSYLGPVTAAYALRYPARVERMVMIGPPPFDFKIEYAPPDKAPTLPSHFDTQAADRVQQLRTQGLDKSRPRDFCVAEQSLWVRQMVGSADGVRKAGNFAARACRHSNEWPVNFYPHLERLLATYPAMKVTPARLANLRQPVLVVHGSLDRNAPIGGGLDWAYYVANGRLLAIPGTAHLVVAEAPAAVAAIRKFIGGTWPDAAKKPSRPGIRASSEQRPAKG